MHQASKTYHYQEVNGEYLQQTLWEKGNVVFVLREKRPGPLGVQFDYEVYRGPSKRAALAFLRHKSVFQRNFYIIVETPEGNYGRDIDGVFDERTGDPV